MGTEGDAASSDVDIDRLGAHLTVDARVIGVSWASAGVGGMVLSCTVSGMAALVGILLVFSPDY